MLRSYPPISKNKLLVFITSCLGALLIISFLETHMLIFYFYFEASLVVIFFVVIG